MRKAFIPLIATTALAPATASATPAPKPDKPAAKPGYCLPKSVGFKARGVLVSSALTQTAGADTAKRRDDRYSGDITVDVKKANHKDQAGEQTYTLTNAKVKFHPRNDTETAAGDRVKLSGKLTKLRRKCDTTGFTPTVSVRKVDVKARKA